MWILLDDSFISVVADTSNPERVQVRARHTDHLAAFLPGCDEWVVAAAEYGNKTCDDDYRYMAYVSKTDLKAAICERIDRMPFGSFRHRIKDPLYYDACNRARADLHAIQPASPYRYLNDPGWEQHND